MIFDISKAAWGMFIVFWAGVTTGLIFAPWISGVLTPDAFMAIRIGLVVCLTCLALLTISEEGDRRE